MVAVVPPAVCRQRYDPAVLASVHMGERQIERSDQSAQMQKARPRVLLVNQTDAAGPIVVAAGRRGVQMFTVGVCVWNARRSEDWAVSAAVMPYQVRSDQPVICKAAGERNLQVAGRRRRV